MLLCILAGCGGAGGAKWQQVHSAGLSFSAPAGWTVNGASAASGPVNLVQVHTFQLRRPYVAARRAATVRELDRDSASIAQQLHGKVSKRSSSLVGGMHAWSYSIDYDGKTEELTFALRGQREYELLCRRAQGSGDAACRKLLGSFNVG